MADITETWNWWSYFGGFSDGIELMKRGVKSVFVKRSPESMVYDPVTDSHPIVRASGLRLIVIDGYGADWTLVPSRRRVEPGDPFNPRSSSHADQAPEGPLSQLPH